MLLRFFMCLFAIATSYFLDIMFLEVNLSMCYNVYRDYKLHFLVERKQPMLRMSKSFLIAILSIIACALLLASCDQLPEIPEIPQFIHKHTEVIDPAISPTCTESGRRAGSHCSECGEVIKAQDFIKPFGHIEVVDEAIGSTCSQTGLTRGSQIGRAHV